MDAMTPPKGYVDIDLLRVNLRFSCAKKHVVRKVDRDLLYGYSWLENCAPDAANGMWAQSSVVPLLGTTSVCAIALADVVWNIVCPMANDRGAAISYRGSHFLPADCLGG